MLKLDPHVMSCAYDLLRFGPVFRRLRTGLSFEMKFEVTHLKDRCGDYEYRPGARVPHVIRLAQPYCSTLEHVMETMAHEMIHMHQALAGTESRNKKTIHNAEFHRIAKRVCDAYGFPLGRFV